MSVPSVNTNILKRKICKDICFEIINTIRRKRKIRSSSVMSVNINVLKEIHRNHKDHETDASVYVPKRVL